jgi:hypothetical protein
VFALGELAKESFLHSYSMSAKDAGLQLSSFEQTLPFPR